MRKKVTISLDEKTVKALELENQKTFIPRGRIVENALKKTGVLK